MNILKTTCHEKHRHLFLDMDGVLVDWDSQYIEINGIAPQEARALGDEKLRLHNWKRFIQQEGFIRAPKTKECDLLVERSQKLRREGKICDIAICSSAGGIKEDFAEVLRQKLAWLNKHGIGFKAHIVPYCHAKHTVLQQGSYSVLVDDRQDVIDNFERHGGSGILHVTGMPEPTLEKLDLCFCG